MNGGRIKKYAVRCWFSRNYWVKNSMEKSMSKIEKEIYELKKRLDSIETWIDFWETVPTPWKKLKKRQTNK